jgi:hypothetical protein
MHYNQGFEGIWRPFWIFHYPWLWGIHCMHLAYANTNSQFGNNLWHEWKKWCNPNPNRCQISVQLNTSFIKWHQTDQFLYGITAIYSRAVAVGPHLLWPKVTWLKSPLSYVCYSNKGRPAHLYSSLFHHCILICVKYLRLGYIDVDYY